MIENDDRNYSGKIEIFYMKNKRSFINNTSSNSHTVGYYITYNIYLVLNKYNHTGYPT